MKIVFICQFSNPLVRSSLDLKSWGLRNFVCRVFKHPLFVQFDYGIWVTDFIVEFEKHINEHDFHIVSPHSGMVKRSETFRHEGIYYHFYKEDGNLLLDFIRAKLHILEKTDYRRLGRRAAKIIQCIRPDVICLCGAENPEYGSGIFNIKDIPILLIPQTFLNDGKRVDMKCASQYRADFEKKVFMRIDAISASKQDLITYVRNLNPDVKVCKVGFPTHKPMIDTSIEKKYDFVFFAKTIAAFKGIEDVIHALAVVKKRHPNVSFAIIGECSQTYRKVLKQLIINNGLQENVCFLGMFPSIDEMHRNVQMAKIAVLPGITASLNSTVREAMCLGIPPIVYENETVNIINSPQDVILSAKMEDVLDLADKMKLLLENREVFSLYRNRGTDYASTYFDNSSIVSSLLSELALLNLQYHRCW